MTTTMPIQECLAGARESLHRHYDQNLRDFELMLIRHGATEEEIEDNIAWLRRVFEEDLQNQMSKLEAWLETWLRLDGKTLQ